jgi:hypothetical protein
MILNNDTKEAKLYWDLIDKYKLRELEFCQRYGSEWPVPEDGSKAWHNHHILPKSKFPEYMNLESNLVYVSVEEHAQLHTLAAIIFDMPDYSNLVRGYLSFIEYNEWLKTSQDDLAIKRRKDKSDRMIEFNKIYHHSEKYKESRELNICKFKDMLHELWNSDEEYWVNVRNRIKNSSKQASIEFLYYLQYSDEPYAKELRKKTRLIQSKTMSNLNSDADFQNFNRLCAFANRVINHIVLDYPNINSRLIKYNIISEYLPNNVLNYFTSKSDAINFIKERLTHLSIDDEFIRNARDSINKRSYWNSVNRTLRSAANFYVNNGLDEKLTLDWYHNHLNINIINDYDFLELFNNYIDKNSIYWDAA